MAWGAVCYRVRSRSRGQWGGQRHISACAKTQPPAPTTWFSATCQPAIMFNKGPKLDSQVQAPSL